MDIGTVLEDGYIVAGTHNGRTLAVAPADKRERRPLGFYGVAVDNPIVKKPSEPADANRSGDTLTQGFISKKASASDFVGSAIELAELEGAFIPTINELKVIRKNIDAIDAADSSASDYKLAVIRYGFPLPELEEGQDPEDVEMPEYITPYVWTSSNHSDKSEWFLTLEDGAIETASFRTMANWVLLVKYVD